MNDSELNGKIDDFNALLTSPTNVAVMAAAKVPVNDIVGALTAKKGIFMAKTAEQDGCKTGLKTATQQVETASSSLYDEFSSRIDAVAGLVGKKSPLGEQILKLRADLLRAPSTRKGKNPPASDKDKEKAA